MHVERIRLENVRHLPATEQVFSTDARRLRRWMLLRAGAATTALLRSVALVNLGRWQMARCAARVAPLLATDPERPARIEFVLIRHAPQERGLQSEVQRHYGWRLHADGRAVALQRHMLRRPTPGARPGQVELGHCQTGRLLLGYSGSLQESADSFDPIPDQRWRRCASLFESIPAVTNPVAYLERLHRKSKYRDGRARTVLNRLNEALSPWLGWSVTRGLAQGELDSQWRGTPPARRIPAMVAIDIARHAFDAAARLGESDPLRQPGVVLFDRMDPWCPDRPQAAFFRLLDGLFPQIQFIAALSAGARRCFPPGLLQQRLPIPQPQPRPPSPSPRRLAAAAVLLVDVDSSLPNLALMKLSRHFKAQGCVVALHRGVKSLPPATTVLASCVFHTPASARRVEALRRHYGPSLQIGGSGVDLSGRLAPEIEALAPDFQLYPELGDRALGFLTRGCPFHCPFCVVPVKEGAPRRATTDWDSLLQGRRKLILLDDNLLAHPDALPLMEEMRRRDLAVNFNQTLDLRLVTPEVAALLRRLHCANVTFTRRNLYFSLNDTRQLELMRERYALLQARPTDNVAFVCMYGFNTTLAEDVARFRFLRSLPGAYVFVQRYLPISGGPPANRRPLFDDQADELLSELVRIVFRQNMKSMETYYRWLAIEYAAQRGRIHGELVETLFRYNGRARMGRFVARLEARCQRASSP